MKAWIAIAFVLSAAVPAFAGDKEDLAVAIRKLREARSFGFKWSGNDQGQPFEADGEFERPGVWTIRHPQFEYVQAGDRARVKVPQQSGQVWKDPAKGGNFFWYSYNMFLYRTDLLIDNAEKADKVTAGSKAVVDGVECRTFRTDVAGKDLRAAVEKFMGEEQKANWANYDGYYDWEQSSGSITIAVDPQTGWIRRVSLDFSRQMKPQMGGQPQAVSAEFTIGGFDDTRAKIPKGLKKDLGLGEG